MDFKTLRENIATFSAILGIATFAASLIYNFFFFWNLGISLYNIPISISDIAQTFLYWLPASLSFLLGTLSYLLFRSKEISKSDLKNAAATVNYLRNGIAVMFVFITISYILIGDVSKIFAINTLTITLLLFALFIPRKAYNFLQNHSSLQKKDIFKIIVTLMYTMMIFIVVGYLGYSNSQNLLGTSPPTSTISINSQKIIKTNIIRVLDEGIIVGTKDESPDFIPWTSISNIKTTPINTEFRGILCAWLGKCWLYPLNKPHDKSPLDTIKSIR